MGGCRCLLKTLFTDEGAHFDKVVTIKGEDIAPLVTWGTARRRAADHLGCAEPGGFQRWQS